MYIIKVKNHIIISTNIISDKYNKHVTLPVNTSIYHNVGVLFILGGSILDVIKAITNYSVSAYLQR